LKPPSRPALHKRGSVAFDRRMELCRLGKPASSGAVYLSL
jgi:hypothetical protein